MLRKWPHNLKISIFRKIQTDAGSQGVAIVLLLLIAIVSHREWFNPFSILSSGDWYHWTDRATLELATSWGVWVNYVNFGMVNIQIPFNIFMAIWSFVVRIGLSFDIASKLTLFAPIAILSFISPYVFSKRLTHDVHVSFVVALFYGTTTYALINQVPIQFVYALSPLVFYFFIIALEDNKLQDWVVFSLFYWIAVCYEIRIMYVVSFVLFFYFIFHYFLVYKRYLKAFIYCCFITIFLSAFWLLPSLQGSVSSAVSSTTNRALFGGGLFSIQQAFTVFTWNWTGSRPDDQFVNQPIQMYFWILPLILLMSFFIVKFKFKKQVIFFWIVSLIGIILTKQSGKPFSDLYQYLFLHFPGFSLFREASKFYIVTVIGYTGLLSFTLLHIKQKRPLIFIFISFVLCSSFFLNLKPLLDESAQGLFVSKEPSSDYGVVESFIESKPYYFRTLWVPVYSRWSFFNNIHPQTSLVSSTGSEWKNLIKKQIDPLINNDRLTEIFSSKFSNQLLNISSLRYVIVPIRDIANDDDFYKDYGERQFFIDELDKLPYLQRIDIGTTELVVYENADYRPHIYTTRNQETIYGNIPFEQVDFQFRNPTEYQISLKNISDPVYVNFSESYHPDWKLRAGDFQWFDVLTKKDYFLPDTDHSQNDAKLNSFLIDPAYIRQHLSKDQYRENPDGSIDVDLTLYFKPQSYFYFGLIISGTTLVGCLGYLGYAGIRSYRRRKNGSV